MKPVCIIGNSHMASLYRAAQAAGVRGVDMFMSDAGKLSWLYLKSGCLTAPIPELKADLQQSGGREDIRIADYAHILVFGCQILCRGFGDDWLLYFPAALPGSGYSERSVRQACLDHLETAFGAGLAATIRQCDSTVRISVLPAPLPSEIHPLAREVSPAVDPGAARRVLEQVEGLYREYFARLDIEVLWFQQAVMADNGFTTALRYRNKSAGDVSHLNEAGAAHVLRAIAAHVGTETAAAFPAGPSADGAAGVSRVPRA